MRIVELLLLYSIKVVIWWAADSVLESKRECASKDDSILRNLSSIPMGHPIDEPALIDIRIAWIRSTLVLQNPAEPVEYMGVSDYLPLIYEAFVPLYGDELQLKEIWAVYLRLESLLAALKEVKCLWSKMFALPYGLCNEETLGHGPFLEFQILICILSEALFHLLLHDKVFRSSWLLLLLRL